MATSSRALRGLEGWFARQAARERRAVYLEDGLLTGRFAAYARFRLRYFLARYLTEAVAHGVKFVVLLAVFGPRFVGWAVLITATASLVASFWWGALEVMRARVRHLVRTERARLVPEEVGRWLSLAAWGAGASLLSALAFIAIDVEARGRAFDVFHLYVAAVGVRLALELGALTFHSGVYAVRRVYRPLPAIVAVEAAGLLVLAAAWPLVGGLGLPLAVVVSAGVSAAITCRYAARLYRFFLWFPLRLRSPRGLRLRADALREFLAAGAGYGLMRLDAFLVLVLFLSGLGHETGPPLFLLFYAISPTVRAGFDWAQLFYFDLKRLETRAFANLSERYERFLLRLASVLGVAFWVAACLTAVLLVPVGPPAVYLLLAPFFVVRSLLGLAQIRTFSARRYGRLLVSGVWLSAVIAGIGALVADGGTRLLWVSLATIPAVALLGPVRHRRPAARTPATDPLPLPEWLRAVRSASGPLVIGWAKLGSPPGAGSREDARLATESASWALRRAATRFARRMRSRGGAVATIDRDWLVWFQPGDGKGTLPWLIVLGGGLWELVRTTGPHPDGPTALGEACKQGGFGPWWPRDAGRDPRIADIRELRGAFSRACPGGVVYAPGEPLPTPLEKLPPREKRGVFLDAAHFAERLVTRQGRGPFEVTALCEGTDLRLMFLAHRRVAPERRARWARRVRAANLAVALAPGGTRHPG